MDWGFTTFLALRDVYNTQKGFLVDDVLEVPSSSLTLPMHKSVRVLLKERATVRSRPCQDFLCTEGTPMGCCKPRPSKGALIQ